MTRRILFAADGTPAADRPFDRAVRIASATGSDLEAFHAVDASLLQASFVRRELREAKAGLQRVIRESFVGPTVKVSAQVGNGDPDTALLARAKTARADLIVMGASDYRGLASAFRGTSSIAWFEPAFAPCSR